MSDATRPLPFVVGELSSDAYDARLLSLTPREVRRCIQALEWFIESHADTMIARGLGEEVARYEDLMYRLMGASEDAMRIYIAGRIKDARG